MSERTAGVLAALGCVAALALAGPAGAADWSAGYNVYVEAGDVGTDPAATISDEKSVDGATGKAAALYPGFSDWPAETDDLGFTCDPGGCAFRAARAGGSVDEAAGLLQAHAGAGLLVGNPPDQNYGGDAYVSGSASLDDAITLSQPATVLLEGSFTGSLAARNGDDDYLGDPAARVEVDLQFGCADPYWTPDGPRCDFGGGDGGYSTDDGAQAEVVCSDPDPVKNCQNRPTRSRHRRRRRRPSRSRSACRRGRAHSTPASRRRSA